MKRKAPVSIEARLVNLPQYEEIREMLLENESPSQITDIIQKEYRQLLEFERSSVRTALVKHRRKIRQDPSNVIETPKTHRRALSQVVRRRYDGVIQGINRMMDLEAVYLVQRDRLDAMLEQEQETGIFNPQVTREFVAIVGTLLAHLKCEMAALGVPEKEEQMMVSFERYSKEAAKALSNPESRRRVVSILERIQRNANEVPSCDQPVSCTPDLPEVEGNTVKVPIRDGES